MTRVCSAGLEWSQGPQKFHKLTQGRRWRERLPTKRRTLPLQRSKRPGRAIKKSSNPHPGAARLCCSVARRTAFRQFRDICSLEICRSSAKSHDQQNAAQKCGPKPAPPLWAKYPPVTASTFICSGQRPPRCCCAASAFSFVRGLLFGGVLSNLSSWILKISARQRQPR